MKIITALAIVLLLLISIGCDLRYGFVESEFSLSASSRIPRFVSVPNGINTKNLLTTITIYSNPISGKARVKVYTPFPEHKIIYDEVGDFKWHPLTETRLKKENKPDSYPQYMIIKVNNIEEIFEQKTQGDVLYVADGTK